MIFSGLKSACSITFTVDESIEDENRPYDLLPYFDITGKERDGLYGLTYELDGSATQFDRDSTVDGWRYFLNPSVSLPLKEIYGYVTPKLGLQLCHL